jgi:hypothetical protein
MPATGRGLGVPSGVNVGVFVTVGTHVAVGIGGVRVPAGNAVQADITIRSISDAKRLTCTSRGRATVPQPEPGVEGLLASCATSPSAGGG